MISKAKIQVKKTLLFLQIISKIISFGKKKVINLKKK